MGFGSTRTYCICCGIGDRQQRATGSSGRQHLSELASRIQPWATSALPCNSPEMPRPFQSAPVSWIQQRGGLRLRLLSLSSSRPLGASVQAQRRGFGEPQGRPTPDDTGVVIIPQQLGAVRGVICAPIRSDSSAGG